MSVSLLICLFQTQLRFPFLLPFCIPWTLSCWFILCCYVELTTHFLALLVLLLGELQSISLHYSPSLAPVNCFCAFQHHVSICSFSFSHISVAPTRPTFWKWMVFLRKSEADCCRATGAGMSPLPADLSNTAVFMLRPVPQLSLPVVLPVFLFPNSFIHAPSFSPYTPSRELSFLSAAVLYFLNLIWAPNMPQGPFMLSEETLDDITS